MRIYVIKRKGASIWQNISVSTTMVYENQSKSLCGYFFLRKKDAEKHLKTYKYSEFFEVIGCSVDKAKGDNRKKT